jgi:hypothetical protein
LTTTGSVQQSQALLRTALDLSAASGADVVSVAGDLSKAFAGQTRSLNKYGLGLTQAELKAMSFEEIQAKITKLFSGQATTAANSYSGSLDKITAAAANAQEIIGKGLVDALGAAGGTGGLAGSLEGIIKLATTVSDLFVGIGRTIAAVKPFFTADVSPIEAFKQYQKITAAFRVEDQIARRQFGGAAATKFQKEAAALAKKNAVESSKLIKNQTTVLSAEQKKQAALKKAGTVFDLEQIQIVAALQGKLSEDDKLRLKAQLALLNGNEVVATALTKQILMAQDQTGNLYKLFLALPDARNPFAYLEGYLNMLAGKAASIFTVNPNQLPPELRPDVPSTIAPVVPSTNVLAGGFSQLVAQGAGASGGFSSVVANAMAQQTIVVQIDGKAVASALQDSSLSGIGSSVNRTGR